MVSGSSPYLLNLLQSQSDRIDQQALANLKLWINDPDYEEFVPEIEKLAEDHQWDQLQDSFYTHLMIGTGGIRGPLGIGPNRINSRTIGEAAQGLCHFIEDYGVEVYGPNAKQAGIVVGYEARRGSKDFAELCCEVFAGNGIRSFLFNGLRATPEVSFAVRFLRAIAGVQITASHNPRTDNGFKFYWSDGGQVVYPHDARFMELVSGVSHIRKMEISEARERGLVSLIGDDVDAGYLNAVRGLSTSKSRSASIVFSPIHGAGSTNVLPVLLDEGFSVSNVAEQIEPDENFPTAQGDLINPEFPEVMELPISLCEELDADVAICSDPDADRVGVAAKISWDESRVQFLTGNQVGAALTQYLLTHRREQGLLSQGDLVLETLVTTGLISAIAKEFKLEPVDDLLVGFKYIAEKIEELENPAHFVFAAEESLGYLAGDFVRDKDAAIASLLICEMVSRLKDQDKTLLMYLDDIYREYGYYKNLQCLVELPGKVGQDIMRVVMLHLRHEPPKTLAGLEVVDRKDGLNGPLGEPANYRMGSSGDVISFFLSDDHLTKVTVRPSGTEPKMKYYIQHYGSVSGDDDLSEVKDAVDSVAAELGQGILAYSSQGLPEELKQGWNSSAQRVL
ncbi:MAG: phospho-sugar mutase [Dehalococcoidia bacterium]